MRPFGGMRTYSELSPTGHLPETGDPGSFGYDDDGNRMRYANHRPSYGSAQVAESGTSRAKRRLGRSTAVSSTCRGPAQISSELRCTQKARSGTIGQCKTDIASSSGSPAILAEACGTWATSQANSMVAPEVFGIST